METKHFILFFTLAGFLQGVGVEISFFVLWAGWRLLHSKMAHKFSPEHFFHKIHEYFE
jgi:hypothetical protein